MNKFASVSMLINCPIEDVWKVAADSENFYRLNLGSHTKFDQSSAGLGTTFTLLGRLGGESTCYITQWNPPHRFAWGAEPNSTYYSFELTESGKETEVYFSKLYDSSTNSEKEVQKYVRTILTALKNICENVNR